MTLRDFGPSEERTVILNHEPNGNGAGLNEFHTIHPEEVEPNNTSKIVGALAVALMVGAAGVYAYTMSGHAANPAPMQQTASLPKTPPPIAPPAMTAPAPEMTAPVAEPVATPAPAPAPVTKSAAAEKPVKSAAAPVSDGASVRMNADSQSTTTSQQAAATAVTPAAPVEQQAAIPEPVSPSPNPSDLANANPQSGVSVAPGATTAQDIPAQAVTPEQPAQQPEAAAPAAAEPAQSAGQVAQ
jgi:hypothetical protein